MMRGIGFKACVFLIALVAAAVIIQAADPSPVFDFTESDSRREIQDAQSVKAEAGNVTQLNINATVITKTWQGYYGNITGKITLDNSDNKSLYDWEIASPEGEIYAANETVTDWSGIKCFNYDGAAPEINLSVLEQALDCVGDADGVNETFTAKDHPEFYVGPVKINTDSCWATKTYVNDGTGQNFYEVLLLEPTNNLLVFTSIINSSATGFDNTPADFQMLVGENGHLSAAATKTPYYFYVELY